MMSVFILVSFTLATLILALFYILGKMSWEDSLGTLSFECGYSSYFYSRFSFSIHFFMIALIFLFLDLELSVILPFFTGQSSEFSMYVNVIILVTVLLIGLLLEWSEGKLDWVI